MTDIAKLEEVIGFLESHPKLHDQNIWFGWNTDITAPLQEEYPELDQFECGTAGCLAGWGAYFDMKNQGKTPGQMSLPHSYMENEWHELGMEVFGLTKSDARILFHGTNTLDTLKLMVKDLANGHPLHTRWFSNKDLEMCRLAGPS